MREDCSIRGPRAFHRLHIPAFREGEGLPLGEPTAPSLSLRVREGPGVGEFVWRTGGAVSCIFQLGTDGPTREPWPPMIEAETNTKDRAGPQLREVSMGMEKKTKRSMGQLFINLRLPQSYFPPSSFCFRSYFPPHIMPCHCQCWGRRGTGLRGINLREGVRETFHFDAESSATARESSQPETAWQFLIHRDEGTAARPETRPLGGFRRDLTRLGFGGAGRRALRCSRGAPINLEISKTLKMGTLSSQELNVNVQTTMVVQADNRLNRHKPPPSSAFETADTQPTNRLCVTSNEQVIPLEGRSKAP